MTSCFSFPLIVPFSDRLDAGSIWTGAFLMGTISAMMCVLYGQFRLGIF